MSGNNIDWPAFWAEHINVPGIVLRVDGSIVYPHTHKLVHAITSAPLGRIVTVAQVEDADTFEVHIEGKPFTFAQFTEDDVQAAIGAAEEFADGAVYCRLLPDGLVLVLKDTPANEGDNVVDRLHAIAQKAVPVLNSMA